MTQYIDKGAVVTKINDWIQDARRRYTMSRVQFSLSDRIKSLENLLSFLNTLEVKEVDINKEISHIAHKSDIEAIKENVGNNNKVEPKFHPGDWIANGGANPCYVKSIFGNYYELCSCEGYEYSKHIIDVNYIYHRWTIADAKDGDVLVASDGSIFLFAGVVDCACKYYVALTTDNYVKINKETKGGYWETSRAVYPATKEQRDLLFVKIRQEGYEWNSDKKELSKQTLKITPKFCVGQLITDDNGNWYKILNIKCLDDWYYEVYDIGEDSTHLELCSIIDGKFRGNRFVSEIKKMMGD